MKSLLITMLLAILPMVNQVNNGVTVGGNLEPLPGQVVVLSVSPDDDSYTYVWDCDGNWEAQEKRFDFSFSGNQITISPKEMKEELLRLFCSVYDAGGNYIGQGEAEIVWHSRH